MQSCTIMVPGWFRPAIPPSTKSQIKCQSQTVLARTWESTQHGKKLRPKSRSPERCKGHYVPDDGCGFRASEWRGRTKTQGHHGRDVIGDFPMWAEPQRLPLRARTNQANLLLPCPWGLSRGSPCAEQSKKRNEAEPVRGPQHTPLRGRPSS